MKNMYNKNWYKVKKNVAQINKEISLLWNCGIINREKAWTSGIKSYMDIDLTPEILGFDKTNSKYKIIDLMLKLLHSNDKSDIFSLISKEAKKSKNEREIKVDIPFEDWDKGTNINIFTEQSKDCKVQNELINILWRLKQ